MYVYVIGSPDQRAVKIGYTTNYPTIRLGQLQTGNPDKLQLFKSYRVVDPEALEKYLHQHYANFNRSEEWFEMDILETIDEVVSVWVIDQTFVDLLALEQSYQQALKEAQKIQIVNPSDSLFDAEEKKRLLQRIKNFRYTS